MAAAESSSGAWRSRPVFISSTFRDMHAERDYLRAHVFPRLEEALRARRHFLEPIDLRLGVETAQEGTEEARELLVLKVVPRRDQAQPAVHAGSARRPVRLGAAGGASRGRRAGTGRSRSTWPARASRRWRSSSASSLKTRRNASARLFFFRQPLPYADMPPDVAAIYSDALSPDATGA